jgi:hypothetical protein
MHLHEVSLNVWIIQIYANLLRLALGLLTERWLEPAFAIIDGCICIAGNDFDMHLRCNASALQALSLTCICIAGAEFDMHLHAGAEFDMRYVWRPQMTCDGMRDL